MNSDNYPPGSFNDPNAPWNEPEQEVFCCWACGKEVKEEELTKFNLYGGNYEFIGDCCIDDFIEGNAQNER